MTTGYDVDYDNGGGGLFLRLKEKGQSVRVRLVSEPLHWTETTDKITDEEGNPKELKKVAWVVILKDLVDGKPVKSVKVYEGGPMVYNAIKALAKSDDWGDPTTYDLTITRTEKQGSYYTVHPNPKPMGPISAEEAELVKAAGIVLADTVGPNRKAKADGGGSSAGGSDEYDPFSD